MKEKQVKIITAVLVSVMFLGVCIFLYPVFSHWWNSYHQSKAVVSYAKAVSAMSKEEKEAMKKAAQAYNQKLFQEKVPIGELTDEQKREYEGLLDITGTGIMGYVEIPKIDVLLPVYHGTDEGVLQTAVGHIEGSSLPVGGRNTHTVISGHRGLPSAKLFTDIVQLKKGDVVYLHVLDEVLTYKVDSILTVEPDEVEPLAIKEGNDECTLVTCTPYGINSHRLLVKGHRIATPKNKLKESSPKTNDTFFFGLAAAVIVILTGTGIAIWRWKRKRRWTDERI